MKKYKFKVWEQISIWREVELEVEANDIEHILSRCRNGDMMSELHITKIENGNLEFSTEDTIQWDYDDLKKENIEEVND